VIQIDKREKQVTTWILNEIAENIEIILNIKLSSVQIKKVARKIISHYYKHKKEYQICVSDIDPYKFCAWSTECLIDELNDKKVIVPIITTMHNFIKKEKRKFEIPYLQYILKMYLNDKKADEFAIGKNGLYMTFSSASNIKIY